MVCFVQIKSNPMFATTVTNIAAQYLPFEAPGASAAQPGQQVFLKPLTEHHERGFFQYIEMVSGQPLNATQRDLLAERLKVKRLRKRQYLLQQGDACKYLGFVKKGAVKMYGVNERGQESIIAFRIENELIADLESFFGGCESNCQIEALEDVELLLLDKQQMLFLLQEIPAFSCMFRHFQMQQMIECQNRINASLSMNAEERYLDLLSSRPGYAQRFSQNMLASYLGVKPETLSRIRNR